jgi:hypothetical protein
VRKNKKLACQLILGGGNIRYKRSFERVVRDLTVSAKVPPAK